MKSKFAADTTSHNNYHVYMSTSVVLVFNVRVLSHHLYLLSFQRRFQIGAILLLVRRGHLCTALLRMNV